MNLCTAVKLIPNAITYCGVMFTWRFKMKNSHEPLLEVSSQAGDL